MITLLSSTQINNPHFSKDGNMRDYCDSPSFKEHPLFRDDPNALQIQLYYDDVEKWSTHWVETRKYTSLVSNIALNNMRAILRLYISYLYTHNSLVN